MLRRTESFRKTKGKDADDNDENADPLEPSVPRLDSDPSRPPLGPIESPRSAKKKVERTPTKSKQVKGRDSMLRTPEKSAVVGRNRFGWTSKNDRGSGVGCDDVMVQLPLPSRGGSLGAAGGFGFVTPRPVRTAGKASSVCSENGSRQSTPTKSVSKPPNPVFGSSRPSLGTGGRGGNVAVASVGIQVSNFPTSVFSSVEVPHFELRKDPSFWMDHNVQVVIRVRPLNCAEIGLQGYNRCLKQDDARSITCSGRPDSRFIFDHVACETTNQESLFEVVGVPMVENCMSGYNSCMFAYGQTGSGKTYTMLGEIDGMGAEPHSDRGITPRIFEFLFARIKEEEQNRRDERLKYNCKCSFLEIYNEQIADLLQPSSTNLLLREDIRKGVFVESLTELAVGNANDILRLLMQGAANRKVAATNMNRESSRSHSVFTCVIESSWEKNSVTNLRFARLNLVDLAGSERQKMSGAEGERLKEAASINKSLSALGHVIMLLVDVANGKQRHVPYRDSRLTFLLQDSLGGNSKTTIVANVSPSICCASETLSTLKFAQRAKFIQNNAFVNEDASGDIIALQHQIRVLKEEVTKLKHQNISRALSFQTPIAQDCEVENCEVSGEDKLKGSDSSGIEDLMKQYTSLEAILAGALRREKLGDATIEELKAEIGHLDQLVCEREEDIQCTKMILKFREDKIQRIGSLVDGLMSKDSYMLEERSAMDKEVQLLQARIERNSEVTRFASENVRLLNQLKRFHDFYEEGERNQLLLEISELRNQLLQILDENVSTNKHSDPKMKTQDCPCLSSQETDPIQMELQLRRTSQELEDCRNNLKSCIEINEQLTREINDIRAELCKAKAADCVEHQKMECFSGWTSFAELRTDSEEITSANKPILEQIESLEMQLDIIKTVLRHERLSRVSAEEQSLHACNELAQGKQSFSQLSKNYDETKCMLKDADALIEALESQQVLLINEMEELRKNYNSDVEILTKQALEISLLKEKAAINYGSIETKDNRLDFGKQDFGQLDRNSTLHMKINQMQASLDKARLINLRYHSDSKTQLPHEQEMEEICRQVEVETAEVILCLQEEVCTLQMQVSDSNRNEKEAREALLAVEAELRSAQERLHVLSSNNVHLTELLGKKETKLMTLTEEWETFARETWEILADGNMVFEAAEFESKGIISYRDWIQVQASKILRSISEKDEMIEELQKSLENAHNIRSDLESKLKSLRGATLVITNEQQKENSDKDREILLLTSQLSEKSTIILELEKRIKGINNKVKSAEVFGVAVFLTVRKFSEMTTLRLAEMKNTKLQLNEIVEINCKKEALLGEQKSVNTRLEEHIKSLKVQIDEYEKNVCELQTKFNAEHEHVISLEDQLEKLNNDSNYAHELSKTGDTLNEFKLEMSALCSCLDAYIEQEKRAVNRDVAGVPAVEGAKYDHVDKVGTVSAHSEFESHINLYGLANHCMEKSASKSSSSCCKDTIHFCTEQVSGAPENAHIAESNALFRKELFSIWYCLNGIKANLYRLLERQTAVKLHEMQSRSDLEDLICQVSELEIEMIYKEKKMELSLQELEHKLQFVEGEALGTCLAEAKANMLEFNDVKILATQKDFEVSILVSQFNEAHRTLKCADLTINALRADNKITSLEVQRLQQIEQDLTHEKEHLAAEVRGLHSCLVTLQKEFVDLVNNSKLSTSTLESLVVSLENVFVEVQIALTEEFNSLSCMIQNLKSHIHFSTDLVKGYLEDMWSGIVERGNVVSASHLCEMGSYWETINNLHVEKGNLDSKLHCSKKLISGLENRNIRMENELAACNVLRGKILTDLNDSFNWIARQENKSAELKAELSFLDGKVVELQLLEKLLLDRSDVLGQEFGILLNDLEAEKEIDLVHLFAKDFGILILSSEVNEKVDQLRQIRGQTVDCERQRHTFACLLENFKREVILVVIERDINRPFLTDLEAELNFLKQDNVVQLSTSNAALQRLIVELQLSNERNSEAERKILMLEKDSHQMALNEMELKNHITMQQASLDEKHEEIQDMLNRIDALVRTNSSFDGELKYFSEENARLSLQIDLLYAESRDILEDMLAKEISLEFLVNTNSLLHQQNQVFRDEFVSTQASMSRLLHELEKRNSEIAIFQCCSFKVNEDLEVKNEVVENLHCKLISLQNENDTLKSNVVELNNDFLRATETLKEKQIELESCYSHINGFDRENHEFNGIIQSLQVDMNNFHSDLCFENESLKDDLISARQLKDAVVALYSVNLKNYSQSFDLASKILNRMTQTLPQKMFTVVDKMLCEMSMCEGKVSKLLEELRWFESCTDSMFSLAESKESESEKMICSIQSLEHELAIKSCKLENLAAKSHTLEVELLHKCSEMSALELDLSREHHSLDNLSTANHVMEVDMEKLLLAKNSVEMELANKNDSVRILGVEILELRATLDNQNSLTASLENDIARYAEERACFCSELLILRRQVEMANALSEENEAIAAENREVAEARKAYAEEKEEEIKLLEKSIEELECTVDVLQNKVEFVKDEAERQRLQREDLEIKLQRMKHELLEEKTGNISTVTDTAKLELQKNVGDLETELPEMKNKIRVLEKDMADKNKEISQYQTHIFEINMHAEAQTQQNAQKIKELETIVEQVKIEPSSIPGVTAPQCEKNAARIRGSGSPFKCIGLGLAQQINSEKDEEIASGRLRVQELESLVASQQKEIFSLNSRLAASESMTHDVIRDLLGVKLDITKYASMVDQQAQQISESSCLQSGETQEKEHHMVRLKTELNKFSDERKGWLEELDRQHLELTSTKLALERSHQQVQFLMAENGALKGDNARHKKMVLRLEDEVGKLQSQQNLQHRIHHHARIKEENNLLKIQKQDLIVKLERSEEILSAVRAELGAYQNSSAKRVCRDVDEDQRLRDQLQDSENERVHLARKLLSLCTCTLKVAGITQPIPDIDPSIVEEASNELMDRIHSLRYELQDMII